ncbi:MAG: pyruvate:ferredoxin (flavodoxin) oxidoreductase [Leptospiraceae bacterium]|nr:pyruvate:ferredoxin (flavodoxin) oxidoreductase [Leptospiraceae bacterium]
MNKEYIIIDGNEAVARVAFKTNEVIAIYPITPSSPMGEWSDQWAAEYQKNIWGSIPHVVELQSEGGAAGTLHGSLQTGSLTTTFTASQGLLLMIPNMHKIAGELTSAVIHVAARSLAAQGLSIFGDHSDVMETRATGFALLSSDSVQASQDFALISQVATLESRIPFIHFFDGFRTSHEIMKIETISDEIIREMIDDDLVLQHKLRGLSSDRPVLRGTAQNPDVYFQARETVNPYYTACSGIVQKAMNEFAKHTGRQYNLFDYYGAKDAERIIVMMGSGCDTASETIDYMLSKGEKVGLIKVRLYRPFVNEKFIECIPSTVKSIAVLDRTKEPGSNGEPLYLDVVQAIYDYFMSNSAPKFSKMPFIIGGRYGLSSKEFTPSMVKAVYDNLKSEKPKKSFTVGILDDVTHTSLNYDENFSIEKKEVVRALFYGLGSDGTVGANKNSIKIIGEYTPNFAQGYFVYDSKKSGSMTVSHLRFGPDSKLSPYLVTHPNFVGCHQYNFIEKFDMLSGIIEGGTFLLNTHHSPDEIWKHLPGKVQAQILNKNLNFYVIDGLKVAHEAGMMGRINTVMQVCFFAISGVLPRDEAIEKIKYSINKTYGKKGDEIVQMNLEAVDRTLSHLHKVDVSSYKNSPLNPDTIKNIVSDKAPEFVKNVLARMIEQKGDMLPVSMLPVDGTYPTGTAQWEKRNIAQEIPVWDPNVCIQCGKCSLVCPHAVIRLKVYSSEHLNDSPKSFRFTDSKVPEYKENGLKFTIQVAPEDCTGCGVCVDICPAKNKSETRLKAINMEAQEPIREEEKANWDYFLTLPNIDRNLIKVSTIRQQQLQEPLFEFSGACAGCGETPYVKLLSQLFGDRMVVANATGCSSIYGGNLPTTPWSKNKEGRGPAWSNSLFEDNAEFGYGFRISIDKQTLHAKELVLRLSDKIGDKLTSELINSKQLDEADIFEQRARVTELKRILSPILSEKEKYSKEIIRDVILLQNMADMLVKKSVWIIGGDGWGYDIGFGGLDHVLSSGRNVNVLLLDTEVYSNTGGQMSKSTPRGAIAKFASGGKPGKKKDLGMIFMSYGNIYVASVAMGARDEHTLKAFLEAEKYEGPSIIIAYSHCIAHGINMTKGLQQQKMAVESGQWLLYRYDPRKRETNENPLILDSKSPKIPVEKYLSSENRFKMLTKSKPEDAKRLFKEAQKDADNRFEYYQFLSNSGGTPSEE